MIKCKYYSFLFKFECEGSIDSRYSIRGKMARKIANNLRNSPQIFGHKNPLENTTQKAADYLKTVILDSLSFKQDI